MRIEQRSVFIAFNGKEFKTEEECIRYEQSIKLKDIMPALKKVKKICSEQEDCCSCVFYNKSASSCALYEIFPDYWDLEKIGG